MQHSLIALVIGFFLDLVLGDPVYSWHPIRLIGKLIKKNETIMRRIFPKTKQGEYAAGLFFVVWTCFITLSLPLFLLYILYRVNWIAGMVVESILCYQMLATRSLHTESMKVYHSLKHGDIEEGRRQVSMLVGRDTNQLEEDGIIRAAVETVAENTSDGCIAPLFYLAIGGAVLGIFYKTVNTMDSMVGYKTEEYLYFGRAAAKLDDVLNYIPARISAGLMLAATFLCRLQCKNAWKIFRRDRYNHSSPNSAQTESVMAGALGIRMGGDAFYFGKLVKKNTIGDDRRDIECRDIKRAGRLLYITALLGIILFGGLRICLVYWLTKKGILT